MNKIKVMALGGLDEEGKDLYLIEVDNNIFVINAGFKNPDKNTPGIDFIIADYTYLIENKDRVKAYILTKAKKNSFGGIPYLYKDVKAPIYCTELTRLNLIKFSAKYNQVHDDYNFKIINLPTVLNICGYKFNLFSTCCSMPDTFGFALETDLGNIVYCGDFIVEYSNELYFKLDLNMLGKIAEKPTLLLMSESLNSTKHGYASPNHKLYPILSKYFKEANGRIFVALSSENFYYFNELFKLCKTMNKKISFYDQTSKDIYELRKISKDDFFPIKNIVPLNDTFRYKDDEMVIVMSDENEKLYEKLSILANNEANDTNIRINEEDTFIVAAPPSDRYEVVATDTIDELFKTGCKVKYVTRKVLAKMHAYEEDLKMLISLLKPKFYMPIQGYYVNLLANAKLAFEMHSGLSYNNIFLLDNGQAVLFDKEGACNLDFNLKGDVAVGDFMIDGIGVGDVVNEIVQERNRLGEDGIVIIGSAVSKETRQIVCDLDIQMRGFLFLKDKEADVTLKEISKIYTEEVEKWLLETKTFATNKVEETINKRIQTLLFRTNNRNPVVKANILFID